MEQDISSTKFKRTDFYKELYYKELERRSSLNNEIALQSTVLIAFLSGLFFLRQSFQSSIDCFVILLSIVIAANVIVVMITGYFLFRSYYDFLKKGRKYEYLPTLKEIDSFYIECAKQNKADTFEDYLINTLVTVTDSHLINNDEKTQLLTKAARWMTRSFFLAAIVVFLFLFQSPIEALFQIQHKAIYTKLDREMENDNQQQSQGETTNPIVVTPEKNPVFKPLVPPAPRILEERSDKTPFEKK